MAVSGSVSQGATLSPLTFTDTSSGVTVTSRSLSVYDADGNLVNTYNMGSNLTQQVPITKDVYYSFVLTLNDNQSVTVNYLSTRQYDLQALDINEALSCSCSKSKSLCNDAVKAELSKQRAITYYDFGQAVNAQELMDAANDLIATTQICNC